MLPLLIERRLEMKLAQRDLDMIIGIATGLTAKWESGYRNPSLFLLTCWINALGFKLAIEGTDEDGDCYRESGQG